MLKRKHFLYFKMLITFLVVFMAAIAIAQAEDPGAADSCTAGNYTLQAIRNANGEFPVKATCSYSSDGSASFPCYKYEYEYTSGDISKIDNDYMAIAYDPYDPITVYVQPYEVLSTGETRYWNIHVFEPCEGPNNEDFGEFICNSIVIQIAPQGNKLTFFASTARNGSGSHFISCGKQKYGCDFPIISAGYYPVRPDGTFGSVECISINERLTMKLERGTDGCDVNAYLVKFWLNNPRCETGVGVALGTTVDPYDPEIDPFLCTSVNSRGCPECIIGDGGTSPTYYTYTTAGGYKVKCCYDLDNPPTYSCPP